MKIIKINESQKKRLFEAYQDSFSFENLTMLGQNAIFDEDNGALQMRYCTKMLGYPDSMGSSRAVYTLSDTTVLKLAYGRMFNAGRAQNRVECELFQKIDSPLLARIFYCDKNYTYLVCESVIPARGVDFERILGIPFWSDYTQTSLTDKDPESLHGGDLTVGYDKYFDNLKPRGEEEYDFNARNIISYILFIYALGRSYTNAPSVVRWQQQMENFIENNEWFRELKDLVQKTKMTDLTQIENFGVVNRNGNPMIVVLDSGFNEAVGNKFYRG